MIRESDFITESVTWSDTHFGVRTEHVTKELYRKIRVLEERLNNLIPTEEQMDKYPSLRDAFEQFIIVRKLTSDNGE
jgi:hypothetical protein